MARLALKLPPCAVLSLCAFAAPLALAAGSSSARTERAAPQARTNVERLSAMIADDAQLAPLLENPAGDAAFFPPPIDGDFRPLGIPDHYSAIDPAPPDRRPASSFWDARKAAAIFRRGRAPGADAPASDAASASEAEAKKPSALQLLQAINAVTQDLSAESVRRLSNEDLQRLSGLILDQLGVPGTQSVEEAAAAVALLSRARRRKLQAWLGKPPRRVSVQVGPPHIVLAEGLPDSYAGALRRVAPPKEGERVFRHYARTESDMLDIVRTASLRVAEVPYVERVDEVNEIFPLLSGVFFTSPDQSPRSVGRSGSLSYVDFKLPAGVAVLELARHRIFVVPLPGWPTTSALWSFFRWLAGHELTQMEQGRVEANKSAGAPGARLALPIEIVDFGRLKDDDSPVAAPRGFAKAAAVPPGRGFERRVDAQTRRWNEEVLGELGAEDFSPRRLLDALKKDRLLRAQFEKVTVKKEQYALDRHTEMVLSQFERYFAHRPLPGGVSKELFRLILALHDIGKPAAVAAGQPALQHKFNPRIMALYAERLGFTESEIRLASALAGSDPIGIFFKEKHRQATKRRPGRPIWEYRSAVTHLAGEAGMSVPDLFELMTIYYMSDAGSYTVDAGGTPALDPIFEFDRAARRVRFGPGYQEWYDELRTAVLATD